MEQKVSQYYKLKQQQRQMETELSALRQDIMDHCLQNNLNIVEIGDYSIRLIEQERRQYDMNKLFAALPDSNLWRLFTKVDQAKLDSLLKLNVVTEQSVQDTYTLQRIHLLRVDKH